MDDLYTDCEKLWGQLTIRQIGEVGGGAGGIGLLSEGYLDGREILNFYEFPDDPAFNYFHVFVNEPPEGTMVFRNPTLYPRANIGGTPEQARIFLWDHIN